MVSFTFIMLKVVSNFILGLFRRHSVFMIYQLRGANYKMEIDIDMLHVSFQFWQSRDYEMSIKLKYFLDQCGISTFTIYVEQMHIN